MLLFLLTLSAHVFEYLQLTGQTALTLQRVRVETGVLH